MIIKKNVLIILIINSMRFYLKIKDNFFIEDNNFQSRMYWPLWSTIFCHLSDSFIIPCSKYFLFFRWKTIAIDKNCTKLLANSIHKLQDSMSNCAAYKC